jgi:uncharacterized protein YggE
MASSNGAGTALAVLLLLLVLTVLGILIYAVWFAPTRSGGLNGAAAATNTTAQQQQRTVDVDGTGTVNAVPDVALVQIGVETQAATVDEATRQNSERSAAVAQSVSAVLGNSRASAENMQTSQYSVTPVFPPTNSAAQQQQPQQQQLQPIGFRVTHEFTVRIKQDPASSNGSAANNNLGTRASAVLQAATQAGANSVRGPTFQVSDQSPARGNARQLAVRDAQRNAAELARLSGVQLGPLLRISESSFVESAAPQQFRALAANSAGAPPPIQSGTSQVTYRISASYGIAGGNGSEKTSGTSANNNIVQRSNNSDAVSQQQQQ